MARRILGDAGGSTLGEVQFLEEFADASVAVAAWDGSAQAQLLVRQAWRLNWR